MLQHYLERFCTKLQKPALRLSREAADALTAYDYPGNVRELVNLCERLAVMCENNPIRLDDLPQNVVCRPGDREGAEEIPLEGTSLKALLEAAEYRILTRALETYGSQWTVARKLGINQSTVSRKMKKYGLGSDRPQRLNSPMP